MSWERRLWEEEQKTQELLEELSYSEEQRRADELWFGDSAFDEDWARTRGRHSPLGWLLGSPYHRGLGGHVIGYLWFMGIALAVLLIGLGLKLLTGYQKAQAARSSAALVQQQAPPAAPALTQNGNN